MLVIKFAACNKKLWKYEKIGRGEVLRCHKHRITRWFVSLKDNANIMCICGKKIGIDKGNHIKMIAKAFTYTGVKKKV